MSTMFSYCLSLWISQLKDRKIFEIFCLIQKFYLLYEQIMWCNCPYCWKNLDPLKKFWIEREGDKVDYKFFRQRIRKGMSKKSAIQATRKHGKHYSVLNANNRKSHKTWNPYEHFTFSDFSWSDVDQSSSYDNG